MWEDPSLLNWDPNDYRSGVHIISSDTWGVNKYYRRGGGTFF